MQIFHRCCPPPLSSPLRGNSSCSTYGVSGASSTVTWLPYLPLSPINNTLYLATTNDPGLLWPRAFLQLTASYSRHLDRRGVAFGPSIDRPRHTASTPPSSLDSLRGIWPRVQPFSSFSSFPDLPQTLRLTSAPQRDTTAVKPETPLPVRTTLSSQCHHYCSLAYQGSLHHLHPFQPVLHSLVLRD